MLRIHRKGYVRKDGTRVKSTVYTARNLGRKGRGPKLFHLKKGGLPGYHARNSNTVRHHALNVIFPKSKVFHRLHALEILTKRTHPNLSRIYRKNSIYVKK